MDRKTRSLFKHTFQEGSGKSVLNYLRKRFYDIGTYTKGDPYHTAYMEGQREVIRFINSVLEQQNEEKKHDWRNTSTRNHYRVR